MIDRRLFVFLIITPTHTPPPRSSLLPPPPPISFQLLQNIVDSEMQSCLHGVAFVAKCPGEQCLGFRSIRIFAFNAQFHQGKLEIGVGQQMIIQGSIGHQPGFAVNV